MSLLKIKGLNKSFKANHVLRGASLDLSAGDRHVIIGPNGAGKTTFVNCIYGTIPLDTGEVILEDQPIHTMPSYKRVGLGIGRTFQKNNLFENLTVANNVYLALLSTKKYSMKAFKPLMLYEDVLEECDAFLEEWKLADRKDKKVNELSYGEQRVMEIILSLCSKPKILLLDEPTSGMSPSETSKTIELIKKIPRSVSILMIEHDMDVVFSTANKITVLHHGETIMSDEPEKIRGDKMIQEIYFGGGARAHA
ncbi:ABC transporter ATP-binding protein [Sporosarcina soli]|uniref:ABC transporter ATP-binding protein n=1 Tax=Sporosarcina soli TaxID=334736 RepID=A0ABW0TFW9_9BACL